MIKTFDYLKTLETLEADVIEAVRRVLHSGRLILGAETSAFEAEFADLVGAKHCIGVGSGTEALHLALLGLGVGHGDEVITVANTCVPTVAAIRLTGATPVFVDVNEHDLMINPDAVAAAITERTQCIVPVHLWGHAVDISRLMAIAERAGIPIVEDCAQAQGTMIGDKHAGTFGAVGCFSFYPTKNLGAYGDAGAIVTDDDDLAQHLRNKRMYGYTRSNYAEEEGMNARISEMQAAILRVKLPHLNGWIERRQEIAAAYHSSLTTPAFALPHVAAGTQHAYHQFVIRCEDRSEVIAALEADNIGYGIHYPTPIHKMPPYQHLSDPLPVTEQASTAILSLPIHEALTDEEVTTIINTLQGIAVHA